METNLSREQDLSIRRVQDILGLSTLNLLRSTLTVDDDSGQIGLHLLIQPEWVDAVWREESETPRLVALLRDGRLSAATVSMKKDGKLSVFLRFAMPAEEPTDLDG
jgi:hypothetical protein